MNQLDQILTAIASDQLGIPTLETRRSDSLDFHDVSVWAVRQALVAAYQAGAKNRTDAPAATQATHTPETWYVDGQADDETQLWIRSLNRPIASIRIGKEPDIDKGNARLIAAAPRMLAALKGTLYALDENMDGPGPSKRTAIVEAHAALAMAEPHGEAA